MLMRTLGRRGFVAGLGGAIACPFVATAAKIPVIGVLWHAGSPAEEAAFQGPLRAGFSDLGYIEGKTITFEDRYPANQAERVASYAAELVELNVDVFVASSVPSALAAQHATSTIPIVFVANPDPVGMGLVSSLAHPGGNITGLSTIALDLAAKRIEILKEALPRLSDITLLVNAARCKATARRGRADRQSARDLAAFDRGSCGERA